MWFELKGDKRLGRCATQDCGGQPTWRFEGDGIGSNFCSGCKSIIETNARDWLNGIAPLTRLPPSE